MYIFLFSLLTTKAIKKAPIWNHNFHLIGSSIHFVTQFYALDAYERKEKQRPLISMPRSLSREKTEGEKDARYKEKKCCLAFDDDFFLCEVTKKKQRALLNRSRILHNLTLSPSLTRTHYLTPIFPFPSLSLILFPPCFSSSFLYLSPPSLLRLFPFRSHH